MVDQTIVDEFSKELSNNDYYGALQTLVKADKDTRSFIVKYLESKSNVDPIKALIHNAILSSGKPSSVVELASKLGYTDYAEQQVEQYNYSIAIKELSDCASRKDWGCADKVISKYKSLGDKELAEAFIYLVSDKIDKSDLEQLNDFAREHGLTGLYEIVNGVLTVDTSGLTKEALDNLSKQIMDDIEKALKTGDIKDLESKYGDLLDKITVKGKSLRDIIGILPTLKVFTDYMKRIYNENDWITSMLKGALSGKATIDLGRVNNDINFVNNALSMINMLKQYNGILVNNLDEAYNGLKSLLARLYLLKGAYYYRSKNPRVGDEWLSKALQLDKGLAEAVSSIKLMRGATMDELLCIIRASGLLGGTHPTFHIRTYGTSTVGSHEVYAR